MDSIQPGSGTAFSLLPAENATGNYVKVVQRVPVKITIDNWPADLPVGPGMPKENDLEGAQDQGGKHGGQAGTPQPTPRPTKTNRDKDTPKPTSGNKASSAKR